MATPTELNDLSVLVLVASDASYRSLLDYEADRAVRGTVYLQSMPDSTLGNEADFPSPLAESVPNQGLTAHLAGNASGIRGGGQADTITFTNWTLIRKFQDSNTGFGAAIFKSAVQKDGKDQYIVAFQGSDGLDGQDWYADLDLARKVWSQDGEAVINFLINGGTGDDENSYVPATGVIHFTGQSLGGGLAQYGAYFYARQLKAADPLANLAQRMTLIDFNGFAAVAGIDAVANDERVRFNGLERARYDPTLLADVQTIHYAIDNDVVHRVGAGNPQDLPSLGGSWHVNGIGNTYTFNFRRRNEDGTDVAGRQNKLSPVDAHRIESGFYRGFKTYHSSFATATNLVSGDYAYLDTYLIQNTGALLSRMFSDGTSSNLSAGARFVWGVLGASAIGPISELNTLHKAIVDGFYDSGNINSAERAALMVGASPISIKAILLQTASTVSKALGVAGWVFSIGMEIFKFLSSSEKEAIVQAENKLLPSDRQLQYQPISDSGATPADWLARYDTYSVFAAQYADAQDRGAVLNTSSRQRLADELYDLDIDPAEFGSKVVDGEDWISDTAILMQSKLVSNGATSERWAKAQASLIAFFAGEADKVRPTDAPTADRMVASLERFATDGIGKALASTSGELIAPGPLSVPNAFDGQSFNFSQYNDYRRALVSAIKDQGFASARPYLEMAQRQIEYAAERTVLRIFANKPANPFDDVAFDPDSDTPALGGISDSSAGTYVLFVPYAAGMGGQRVRIELSGTGADKIRVLSNGAVVPVTDGAFFLTVEEGRKQVSFSLEGASDLGASGTVAVSATLVDAQGIATHQTHVEANLSLVHEDKTFAVTFDAATATDFASADKIRGYFNQAGTQNDPTQSRTRLLGTGAGDLVIADHASESVEAGAGKDFVIETAGLGTGTYTSGDAIDAGSSNDFIAGYLGGHISGGDGDDFVNANAIITLAASRLDITGAIQLLELPPEIYADLANFIRIVPLYDGPLFNELVGSLDFAYVADFGNDNLANPIRAVSGKMGVVASSDGTQIQRTATGGAQYEFTTASGIANIKYIGATTALTYGVAFQSGGDIHNVQAVQVDGGAGNDLLYGAGGEDFIKGGLGNDRIAGFDGDDTLEGDDGNDLIVAGGGDDYVDAGAGNDNLWGEGGNDGLWGGEGRDVLYGDADATPLALQGDDYLDGGAGDDQLFGNGGNDELFGADGPDVVDGGDGRDYLDGEAGNDALRGGAGDDQLFGGEGDDSVAGDDGDDYVDGEIGNDALEGSAGNDNLFGGDGGDSLLGGSGEDYLDGEGGSDRLLGGDGNDTVYGGDDNDRLEGGAGNDRLIGGAGDNLLLGDAGDDAYVLDLRDDHSVIDDQLGANSVVFVEGVFSEDVVARYTDPALGSPDLVLTYGAGSRVWIRGGGESVQAFQFADGTSLSRTEFLQTNLAPGYERRANILIGTVGSDVLADSSDADVSVYALEGNDTIVTGSGGDYLDGGPGLDMLQGGAGDDTYVYDAVDVVIDTQGLNRVVFEPGITPADLRLSSLVVGAEPRLLIAQRSEIAAGLELRGAALTTPNFIYTFADGQTLSQVELLQASYYAPQNISGGSDDDFLFGFAGDDVLSGGDGNDTLVGNAGNDALSGYDGDDIVYGGPGDDNLGGGSGSDSLYGGTGNDLFDGGPGGDTYFFGYGDGQDRVSDGGSDSAIDRIRLADGISPPDVSVRHDASGDLVLTLTGTQDKLNLQGWYTNESTRVERIEFADGTVFGETDLVQLVIPPITGSAANDVLIGSTYDDTLEGIAGDDTLDGGLGDDVLVGGPGSDTYVLGFGSGRRTVIEQPDETSTIALAPMMTFDDLIGTRTGDDLFLNVRGTDDGVVLKDYYTEGHDWRVQGYGGAPQSLADFLAAPPPTTGDPILDFWEARQTRWENFFYGLSFSYGDPWQVLADGTMYSRNRNVDTSVARNYYNGDVFGSGSIGSLPVVSTLDEYRLWGPINVVSSNAASLTVGGITKGSQYTSTPATYVVDWNSPRLRFNTYYAGTIVGGDLLVHPLYYTEAYAQLHGEAQSIEVGSSSGATSQELTLAAFAGRPLPSEMNGSFGVSTTTYGLDEVHGGPSNNVIQFTGDGFVDAGAGDDLIDSSSGGDWLGNLLYGNVGNDRLTGSGESDFIIGGPGNDRLAGYSSDDTYYFFASDVGVDVVNEATWYLFDTVDAQYGYPLYDADSGFDSTDTVEFGAGITLDGLTLSWGTVELPYYNYPSMPWDYDTLDVFWGTGRGVRVVMPREDAQMEADLRNNPGASWGVEYFGFADGTVLTMEQMIDRMPVAVFNGTADDDYLLATLGRDVLAGGAGSDYLEGQGGDDTYRFNLGDGEDWIDDRQGSDTLAFGAGITPEMLSLGLGSLRIQIGSGGDVLHIERFDPDDALASGTIETYQFADGTALSQAQLLERGFDIYGTASGEMLSGTSVQDRIFGFGGNDVLLGGAGDDLLDGGPGNDALAGGKGSDLYVFGIGSGQDLVDETDAQGDNVDVIALGTGVTPDNLRFSRVAQNLVLTIDGTADTLTMRDWYESPSYQIEEIRFEDSPTWDSETIAAFLPQPSPPVLAHSLADQTASEDVQFLFSIPPDIFVDPDAGSLTYTALRADGTALPEWLTFNPSTRSFSGSPAQADVGMTDVRVVATDPDGLSAEDVFTLRVLNTNDAPVLANAILDQAATEGTLFTFIVAANTFFDQDPGDILTLKAERYGATSSGSSLPPPPPGGLLPPPPPPSDGGSLLPSWLHFDAATRIFSGTPANGDVGALQIKVTASDAAGASVSDVFEINVVYANHPPVVQSFIADQVATEDSPFSFTVPSNTITDPDAGEVLTWSAVQSNGEPLPGWLAFDAINRAFAGTPTNDDVGSFSVRVTATDRSNASASEIFAITVANTNDAPTLSLPIADQAGTEDEPFEFVLPSATFVDVDTGDSLALSATAVDGSPLPAWLQFDAPTGAFRGTPANEDVGFFSVRVTATDTSGTFASDVLDITVVNTNDAPTLEQPISDQSATEDEAFELAVPSGTFADVDVGDTATLSASLADGSPLPSWLTLNTATLCGTPLNEDVGGYDVRLTATDAAGATAIDVFHLDVANVNDAPVVGQELADQYVEAGAPFFFTVPAATFFDVDAGDVLDISVWGELPAWLNFDPATATFSGSPGTPDIGVSGVIVSAADTSGASVSSDFALIVTATAGSTVRGGSGDEVFFGSTGDETLSGARGDDALFGGMGNDILNGGGGNDVLQGGDGNDVLRAGPGASLLDGGSGDDVIFDGAGNSFIAGGAGNDTIRLSAGEDIIAFNRGDGWDAVYGGGDGGNTLSLGGGIRYSDLSLSKSGSDLVLKAGENDGIVLKDWYGGTHSLLNLQLIQDATEEFDAASSDPLRNRRVQTFDFLGLVRAFDQSRMSSPGLSSWQVTNALLEYHLWGADDFALGGDLAYWFGRNRSLAGLSLTAAQQIIGAPDFGSDAQALRPFSGLQEGFVKLS